MERNATWWDVAKGAAAFGVCGLLGIAVEYCALAVPDEHAAKFLTNTAGVFGMALISVATLSGVYLLASLWDLFLHAAVAQKNLSLPFARPVEELTHVD